ncbi:MAG: signal peptidase I, partial [Lachnospiraceae bacterium]|nr:signal peptidase I [Lachnospiraceae bacterium]
MEPTLQNGDVVFFLRIGKDYQDGDVVFARMPSGDYYVKRVIATEGEVVDLIDGKFYIDGVEEQGEYILGVTEAQKGIVAYPYTVEEGTYFMVGDNREGSMDSRSFGALPEGSIKGKLWIR